MRYPRRMGRTLLDGETRLNVDLVGVFAGLWVGLRGVVGAFVEYFGMMRRVSEPDGFRR